MHSTKLQAGIHFSPQNLAPGCQDAGTRRFLADSKLRCPRERSWALWSRKTGFLSLFSVSLSVPHHPLPPFCSSVREQDSEEGLSPSSPVFPRVPEGLFLVVAAPLQLTRGGAATAARPPSAGKPRVRDGEGGPGPFLRHWPPGWAFRGRAKPPASGGRSSRALKKPSAAVPGGRPGRGWSPRGRRSRARRPASQPGAGTAGPAGRRRGDPRGRALGGAGCRRPGRSRGGAGGGSVRGRGGGGGGLRGWGVSCVPARSPRRGLGGRRRLHGRGRSASGRDEP